MFLIVDGKHRCDRRMKNLLACISVQTRVCVRAPSSLFLFLARAPVSWANWSQGVGEAAGDDGLASQQCEENERERERERESRVG